MDSKNYRSLGDAYKQMFMEAPEGGKPDRPGGAYPVPVPFRPLRPVQVHRTNIEIDVTQPYVGPGEVEKAYYTYPAGFDPTNREDVAKKDYNGSEARPEASTKTEDIEIIGDYLMEAGLVSDAKDVDHFYSHMSDEWKSHIVERCWKGYKPTPGKKAYDKGSCQKS